MRFKEFAKLIEKKLIGQDETTGYYTVGDSHAVGLANYAGKPWINKGKDGMRSTEPMHYQAIDSIPKGSVVLISAGANDTFAGAGANPQTIAGNVAKLVNTAKSKGLKVTYLLFPVGTRPNAELREKTREAIKQSIDVPVVDLEGSTLVDGVHANAAGYKKASAQILSGAKPSASLGTPDAEPGAPTTKDRIKQSSNLEQGPPFPSEQKDEVKKMQQSLQELGYSVGRLGVDGKYGPATAAAVAAFKKDYQIDGPGSSFGEKEFNMLAQINAGQVARVKEPTKVANIESPNIVGTKERNAAFKEPYFMEKVKKVASNLGINEKDLIGIMNHESGLNPRAVNPMSKAVGLIQFMPKTAIGLGTSAEEILKMSATEQMDLVEKYYKKNGVHPGDDIADLYMLTFMPAARDKPDSFVLGNVAGGSVFGLSKVAVYKQNRTFDANGDGIFTVGDVKDRIRKFA